MQCNCCKTKHHLKRDTHPRFGGWLLQGLRKTTVVVNIHQSELAFAEVFPARRMSMYGNSIIAARYWVSLLRRIEKYRVSCEKSFVCAAIVREMWTSVRGIVQYLLWSCKSVFRANIILISLLKY